MEQQAERKPLLAQPAVPRADGFCLSFLPAPGSYKIHQSSLGQRFLMQLITAEVHHQLPS